MQAQHAQKNTEKNQISNVDLQYIFPLSLIPVPPLFLPPWPLLPSPPPPPRPLLSLRGGLSRGGRAGSVLTTQVGPAGGGGGLRTDIHQERWAREFTFGRVDITL